jgi:hypothetical protein
MHLVNLALGSSRWEQMEAALRGLERTGVPLVAATGTGYGPAGVTDDPGIYYLVPRVALATGWDLTTCLERVLFGTVALSLLAGLAGLFLLFRDAKSRLYGCFALGLVSAASLVVGGVYVFQSAVVVAMAPWIIWAVRKEGPAAARFGVLLTAAALAAWSNFLRSHAGTPVLFLAFVLVVLHGRESQRWKAVALLCLAVAALSVTGWARYATARRDAYLGRVDTGYVPISAGHPFWHSVYIGFGFLPNDEGIRYADEVAAAKVRSVSPAAGYLSSEYESVLRREVFRLVVRRPGFVLRTLFAKLGVTFLFFLIFANAGVLAAKSCRKPAALALPLWAGLGFSALNGVLVVPSVNYLLGFCAFAAVYGAVSVGWFFDEGRATESWLILDGGR